MSSLNGSMSKHRVYVGLGGVELVSREKFAMNNDIVHRTSSTCHILYAYLAVHDTKEDVDEVSSSNLLGEHRGGVNDSHGDFMMGRYS